MAVRSDRPIVQLDDPSVISQRIRSVVRGPLPNNFNVRPLLDPLQGNHKGVAEIQRRYPLLPRLGGLDTGEIANPLLDRKFTNAEMNFRNVYRRTRALYDMPWDQGQWARFEQTWQSIPQLGSFAGLRVLEYDDDWVKYSHDYRNWHYMAIPDFHPRVVSDRCTLDFAEIYRRKVEPLLDVKQPDGSRRLGQITLLPRTMTRAFLSMFDRTRREMEDELRMLQQNPPPGDPSVPAKIAFIQGELPIVKTKISQLERFQKRIPTFERQMASRR